MACQVIITFIVINPKPGAPHVHKNAAPRIYGCYQACLLFAILPGACKNFIRNLSIRNQILKTRKAFQLHR